MSSVPIGSDIDVAAALRHLSPERGWLVLPAFAEPHAHLDKAFLAERCENVTGDLMGAIDAMVAYSPQITLDDIVERAERAALLMLANGTTAIRTHADVMAEKGLRNVEALLTVRERLAHLVDIEIVVLCGWPSCGEIGKVHLDLMREALRMGADLVGGCPHLEDDGNVTVNMGEPQFDPARIPFVSDSDALLQTLQLLCPREGCGRGSHGCLE